MNPVKDNRKIDIQTVRVRITQSRITCRNHQRFFSFGLGFVSDLWLLEEGNGWQDGDCRGGKEFSQWSYSVGNVKVKFSSCQAPKENYICFIFRIFQNTHTHFVFYLIEIKAYFTRLSPPLHSSNKPNVTFLTHPPYIVKHKKLILCFFVFVLLPDSPPLHTISCHTYIHAYRSLLL